MINQRLMKGTIHWLLTVVIIVYLITGFGITEYRIVDPLNIEIPFIILLILHIWLLPLLRYFRLKKLGNK